MNHQVLITLLYIVANNDVKKKTMCYYALLICMLLCLLRTYVLYKYCYIISVKSVKDMFAVFCFLS